MGTLELSGLRFPRVTSPNPKRGNKQLGYSCQPPSILRDFVAFCSENPDTGPIDATYLLPFHGTSQVYAGNNAQNVPGAPHTCTTDDPANPAKPKPTPECRPNRIVVEHQDGTTAQYRHVAHHGSSVAVGDIVKRGQ